MKTNEKTGREKLASSRMKYVFPNLVTATNLSLGAVSTFLSFSGNLYWAGWIILLSVLLDKLDGTTARLLGASSRFGVEFDSLADLIAFGLAPAVFAFSALTRSSIIETTTATTVLSGACCCIYVLCSAIRLARFNVEDTLGGSDVYFGLAMPMAGGLTSSALLFMMKYAPHNSVYQSWALDYRLLGNFSTPDEMFHYFWIYILFLSFLMVSGVKVPKLKRTGKTGMDIYLVSNIVLTYLVVPFRVFPGYLWLVAFQYLAISVFYTLFIKDSKKHKKRDFLDVLSVQPYKEKPVKTED